MLAGWSSGSNYPLLGAIRSSAQMISYEVGMGLALVAVAHVLGHAADVARSSPSQDRIWNVIPQFPAFVIYLIAGLAETNRPPFDLPEAESELVAGYHTEYSGIKFAMFYLGEYLNTVTVAAVAVDAVPRRVARARAGRSSRGSGRCCGSCSRSCCIVYVYIWIRATLPADPLRPADGVRLEAPDPVRPRCGCCVTGAIVVLPDVYGRERGRHGGRDRASGWSSCSSLIWPLFAQAPTARRCGP